MLTRSEESTPAQAPVIQQPAPVRAPEPAQPEPEPAQPAQPPAIAAGQGLVARALFDYQAGMHVHAGLQYKKLL